MNTIPKVNYEYARCRHCNGDGLLLGSHVQIGWEIYECPNCDGTGEVLEVESVEDVDELIEEEE